MSRGTTKRRVLKNTTLKAQDSNQNKGDTYNISISEETEVPPKIKPEKIEKPKRKHKIVGYRLGSSS